MSWDMTSYSHTANSAGVHLVFASRTEGEWEDITYFRGVPCIINDYTFSDPYSDATASITFPQITEMDDLQDVWWCREFTQINIYWVPASDTKNHASDYPATNPDTGKTGWWINTKLKGNPIWEGHTYSYTPTSDGATVQCQGAMFAVDRYISKPTFPPRPQTAENLIRKAFNTSPTHLLSFNPEHVLWPSGYTKTYTDTIDAGTITDNYFTVDGIEVGDLYSGYATRNTGNWGRMLTGFVSEMLGVMYTPDDCGAVEGNQWTVTMGTGRQPYLKVRDRFKTPDFKFYAGTPGTHISLSRDALSTSSIYYGTGTAVDGSHWSNTVISPDGLSTGYDPVAYFGNHFPLDRVDRPYGLISGETMIQFGTGIGLDQAITAGQKMLKRDYDPGWVGDIELEVDPSNLAGNGWINKWTIEAGMCVQVMNYAGLSTLNLHVAQVRCSPEEGKVTLSVDSKFRDLLTLEEVTAKIRDPLTPAKLLKVGQRTGIVEDQLAPWDYTAGSGMVTTMAKEFFLEMPSRIRFPWTEWTLAHPPADYGEYYVAVDASALNSANRWSFASFLTSAKGNIRLTQFVCVNEDGEIVEIPFHVSIHNLNMIDDKYIEDPENEDDEAVAKNKFWAGYCTHDPDAPNQMEAYSPFLNAKMWENIDEDGTVLQFPYTPPDRFRQGWGNYNQPAGYSPGRKNPDNTPPTGMLLDESSWPFDNMGGDLSIERIDPQNLGNKNSLSQTKLLCAIYAEHDETVYFIGRMWKQEEGF